MGGFGPPGHNRGHSFVGANDHTDGPASYSGQAGKACIVKATEDGMEFGVPGLAPEVLDRALGGSAGDYVEIGSFVGSPGGNHNLLVTVTYLSGGVAYKVTKTYLIAAKYAATGAAWMKAIPIRQSGQDDPETTELCVKVDSGTLSLRLWRLLAAAGLNWNITILNIGDPANVFTASSASGNATAPTVDFVDGVRVEKDIFDWRNGVLWYFGPFASFLETSIYRTSLGWVSSSPNTDCRYENSDVLPIFFNQRTGQLKFEVRRNNTIDFATCTLWVNGVADTNIDEVDIDPGVDNTWTDVALTPASTFSPGDELCFEILAQLDNGDTLQFTRPSFEYEKTREVN